MNNEGAIDPATGDFVPGPNYGKPEIDEYEAEVENFEHQIIVLNGLRGDDRRYFW